MTGLSGQVLILGIAMALWNDGAVYVQSLPNATAEIVILNENTTSVEGTMLILTCVGYGVPSPDMMWLKDDVELSNNSRVSIYSTEVEAGGILFVQSTLEICSTEQTDEGTYSCTATNEEGSNTLSFEMSVEQRATSEVVILNEDTTSLEGNMLILTCVGYGVPSPDMMWLKDGVELSNNSRVSIYSTEVDVGDILFIQSTLEICSTEQTDEGTYSCTATNVEGSNTLSFEMSVEQRATSEVVILNEDTTSLEGNMLILTCVGYGVPSPDMMWLKDDVELSNNSRVSTYSTEVEAGGILFIQSTLEICSTEQTDEGTYSCTATNEEGSNTLSFIMSVEQRATAEVVILNEDTTSLEGNMLILTCVGYGVPSPDMMWLKGNVELSNNSRVSIYSTEVEVGDILFVQSTLEICSVEQSDKGTYSCTAANEEGSNTLSFRTSVKQRATAEVVILNEDTTSLEGNMLILTCVGYGVPSPDMMWLKDGVELSNNSRVSIYSTEVDVGGILFVQSTLEICSIEQSDKGMYSCAATNVKGTETHSFQLVVEFTDIEMLHNDTTSVEGAMLTLTCMIESLPSPDIMWLNGSLELSNNTRVSIYTNKVEGGLQSTLEIRNVELFDEGMYFCVATNDEHSEKHSFQVQVTMKQGEIEILHNDTTSVEGAMLTLTCMIESVPSPDIMWLNGSMELSNNTRVSIYKNKVEGGLQSTLEIRNVELFDEGMYFCVATNDEHSEKHSFQVQVTMKQGEIEILHNDTTSVEGAMLTLTCMIESVPSPDIMWLNGSMELSNNTRVSIYTNKVEGGLQSTLEIRNVELFDEGMYFCVATNDEHSEKHSFQVQIAMEQSGTGESDSISTWIYVVVAVLLAVTITTIVPPVIYVLVLLKRRSQVSLRSNLRQLGRDETSGTLNITYVDMEVFPETAKSDTQISESVLGVDYDRNIYDVCDAGSGDSKTT